MAIRTSQTGLNANYVGSACALMSLTLSAFSSFSQRHFPGACPRPAIALQLLLPLPENPSPEALLTSFCSELQLSGPAL